MSSDQLQDLREVLGPLRIAPARRSSASTS